MSCTKGVISLVDYFWFTFPSCRIGLLSLALGYDTSACWQRSCLVVGCMSYIESVISWWVDVTVFVGFLYLELVYYFWFIV